MRRPSFAAAAGLMLRAAGVPQQQACLNSGCGLSQQQIYALTQQLPSDWSRPKTSEADDCHIIGVKHLLEFPRLNTFYEDAMLQGAPTCSLASFSLIAQDPAELPAILYSALYRRLFSLQVLNTDNATCSRSPSCRLLAVSSLHHMPILLTQVLLPASTSCFQIMLFHKPSYQSWLLFPQHV